VKGSSLASRLVLGATLWTAVAVICTAVVLEAMFRRQVMATVEAGLAADLNQILAATELGPEGTPVLTRRPAEPLFEKPYSGRYFQLGAPGSAPLRSRSLWDAALALPPDDLPDGTLHRHEIAGPAGQRLLALERSIRLEGAAQPLRVAVAADLAQTAGPLREFRGTLIAALGTLGLGLVGAVLLQVRFGLRPLARLRAALAELRAGRRARLTGDWPQEVMPLVQDFDAVLDHNEAVLERARTQAGNLAHALKTPITVLSNAADAQGPALAETVRLQAASMRRQIDQHLARARAAATAGRPGAHADAVEIARQVARTLERLNAERGVAIRVEAGAVPPFRGDADDLAEILGNVVENAAKWARGRVEVRLAPAPEGLEVIVDDDGAGLPPGEREEVFRRGKRLDETVPGSGLGLAIVRDLVGLYGGRIALEDSPLGGLRVRLGLPAAPARVS
jgi:signal transduction histidine kinase